MDSETGDAAMDSQQSESRDGGIAAYASRVGVYQGFLVVLTLIAFSELGFSNLNTLLTNLEGTADQFGLSIGAERFRLVVLIVLDAVAGAGAAVALAGFRRTDVTLFRRGLSLTLGGFFTYGVYQVGSAQLQLAAEYTVPVTVAGIVYAVFGLLAYFGGVSFLDKGELRR